MIRLGCMSLSYKNQFAAGRMDLLQFIDKAYELRLDGVEFHARAFASDGASYLRDVRMRCLQRGLTISYIGVSNDFGRPHAELKGVVDDVKHWVDVAAFMGVPLVRIFAAWVRGGESEEQVWDRMMPCMHEVAAYGQEKGVVLGLHNHNHGCVTRTGKDVNALVAIEIRGGNNLELDWNNTCRDRDFGEHGGILSPIDETEDLLIGALDQ